MKKTMTKFLYFFLVIMLSTIALKIIAKENIEVKKQLSITDNITDTINNNLPDEDSTILNSVLSAIGGFSGGGLLLIFLIRRLVNSYDESFTKWENRCTGHNQRQDEKNSKMSDMIEEIHDMTQDLKLEIIKLQANSVSKDSITGALTKVDMLEDDVGQVREEIKSIMVHLINKPKSISRS